MLYNKRLPNTTVKFPDSVKRLIKRDARREGHSNMSHVVRRIVMQHYGLIRTDQRAEPATNGNGTDR